MLGRFDDLEALAARRPRLVAAAIAALLVTLVAWSAWNRWTFLTSSPYPMGIDGYFYPLQLRSLLDHGTLRYPSSPLGFWLMAPLAALTDPMTGAKLGAALFGALVALPTYAVGRRLGGSRPAGLLAAALATPSAGSFYLTIEFVKNGIGVTVAMTYLWLLLRAFERPSRGRVIAAAAGFAAAVLTHKFAAGLALVVTVPAVAVEIYAHRTSPRWRWLAAPGRLLVGAAIVGGGVLLLSVGASILFPDRFLGLDELHLIDRMFTSTARWEIPTLQLGRRTMWLGHEPAIGGVLGLAVLGLLAARRWWSGAPRLGWRPGTGGAAVALAALAVLVALPWLDVGDVQGLPFRLRIVAFVPMALVGAAAAGLALARVTPTTRATVALAFAVTWVGLQPPWRDEGVVRAHPAMVSAVIALDGALPDDAMVVIPERHILFMVAWYTRYPAWLHPDHVPEAHRWRIMPLAFIGRDSPLDRALMAARAEPGLVAPIGTHPRHPDGLVAVPEATWRWVLDRLPERARQRFQRWPTI